MKLLDAVVHEKIKKHGWGCGQHFECLTPRETLRMAKTQNGLQLFNIQLFPTPIHQSPQLSGSIGL